MRTLSWLVLFVALVGLAGEASGATIRHMEVTQEGEGFQVRMEAVVGAPPDRVFALLTAFDRLGRVNPAVVESERLGTERDPARVRTVMEKCMAFFCRRLEQVQEIRTREERLIRGKVVPEASDFRTGHYRWELAAITEGTRVRFRARMVPDFWVPPLIGAWAVESSLKENLRAVVRHLERLGDLDDQGRR